MRYGKRWRVFYRLKTHDVITGWQEAKLTYNHIGIDPPPEAYIEATDGLLQGIHWRGRELGDYFKKILTPATELYELSFRLVEDEEKDYEI